MMPLNRYDAFLASKAATVAHAGFEMDRIPPYLFDFQEAVVRWALRLGRAAIFAGTGLGKTRMQVAFGDNVAAHTRGSVLILAPLAVSEQTVREAASIGIGIRVCKSHDDVRKGLNITNYERLERFDLGDFDGIILDESSILKSQDGATRSALIEGAQRIPYRLACTATPSPNDYMELGNHAEFLGAMTRSEMLSMFFINDQDTTQKWRLKGHANDAFWKWVCSWALLFDNPEQLGFDGARFILPPLEMREHLVASEAQDGFLLPVQAQTLLERRAARRASMTERVAQCVEIVQREPNEQWLLWCDLNAESDALEIAIPGAVQVAGSDDADFKVKAALDFIDGTTRILVSKPSMFGFGLNLQNCSRMVFVGLSDSFEQFYQAVRRCWRFGQARPVECHIITSQAEGAVLANIQRKEADAQRMRSAMIRNLRLAESFTHELAYYTPTKTMRVPSWLLSA